MNIKTTIQKVIITLFWIAAGTGLLVLLIAAMGKQRTQVCAGYSIKINGSGDELFIRESDIMRMLQVPVSGDIKGKALNDFKVNKIEDLLESYSWISNAETYFDNQDILHVIVTEKTPVARIFTVSGHSFYIDSLSERIPLSGHYTARVPVFTGFPESKKWLAKDSILLAQVTQAALFIRKDDFWQSQVSQVDIQPDYTMEMIPVIGNHTVLLGEGTNIDKKLNRLFAYYKHVAGKKGFDAYDVLNVQFENQVIGIRGTNENDKNKMADQRARSLAIMQAHYDNSIEQTPVVRDQQPVTTSVSQNGNKQGSAVKPGKGPEKRVPKAVMPKREN